MTVAVSMSYKCETISGSYTDPHNAPPILDSYPGPTDCGHWLAHAPLRIESWSLHSNHEQIADRMSDEFDQRFWIDA